MNEEPAEVAIAPLRALLHPIRMRNYFAAAGYDAT